MNVVVINLSLSFLYHVPCASNQTPLQCWFNCWLTHPVLYSAVHCSVVQWLYIVQFNVYYYYTLDALRLQEVLKVPLGRLVVRPGALFQVFDDQTDLVWIGEGIVRKRAEIEAKWK